MALRRCKRCPRRRRPNPPAAPPAIRQGGAAASAAERPADGGVAVGADDRGLSRAKSTHRRSAKKAIAKAASLENSLLLIEAPASGGEPGQRALRKPARRAGARASTPADPGVPPRPG